MTTEPTRRLSLADAMLLVAATAPGLLLLRVAAGLGLFSAHERGKAPLARELVEYASVAGGCVLLGLAVAVLALGLRGPRPSWRRDAGGPGFAACAAVMAATLLPLAYLASGTVAAWSYLPERMPMLFNNSLGRLTNGAGPMVLGAWLALALAGRWRPRPTWTDRLGLVVGAGFVLIYGYGQLYFVVQPLLVWWSA